MKTVHSRTPPEWLAAGYRNDFMRTWVSGRSFAEGCARGACRSGGWLVAGGGGRGGGADGHQVVPIREARGHVHCTVLYIGLRKRYLFIWQRRGWYSLSLVHERGRKHRQFTRRREPPIPDRARPTETERLRGPALRSMPSLPRCLRRRARVMRCAASSCTAMHSQHRPWRNRGSKRNGSAAHAHVRGDGVQILCCIRGRSVLDDGVLATYCTSTATTGLVTAGRRR